MSLSTMTLPTTAGGASWRAADHPPDLRPEVWRTTLETVYDGWAATGRPMPGFDARLLQRRAGPVTVVDCICDPCAGSRRRPGPARDGRELVVIQLVLGGREQFSIGEARIALGPGDVLVWTTTRPMSFEVTERLHKRSVVLPLARLRHWLPGSWQGATGRMAAGTAGAALVSGAVGAMAGGLLEQNLPDGEALGEAMLGVLVAGLGAEAPRRAGGLRAAQLDRVKALIDARLDDPDLDPAGIAAAAGISLRHLHALFGSAGTTVRRHLITARLDRCRRDLANPVMAGRTITDIAFSWGFQNAGHFGRRFRDAYGLSPQAFRQRRDR